MISKFPASIIQQYGDFFFVPLVAQLVNDTSSDNRLLIASAIKVIQL